MRRWFILFQWSLILIFLGSSNLQAEKELAPIRLKRDELEKIAYKIWKNECNGSIEGLTSWNAGESFASLGIGHFIWYPAGKKGPFEESFPKFLCYVATKGVKFPEWLLTYQTKPCPWSNRESFTREFNSLRMNQLRIFLKDTVSFQAEFMFQRLSEALPKMTANLSEREKKHIQQQFMAVAQSYMGAYALMDYVNFKGEGVSPTERYKGMGWGLLQVLQGMPQTPSDKKILRAFADSAKTVLIRRVKNSPLQRNEAKWLPGWLNRCETYAIP